MKPSDLLRTEARLQRQSLRAEIDSLRRRPTALVKGLSSASLGALALRRILPGLLGRRAPWAVYGWLAYKAVRVFFPPTARKRLPRR